MSRAAGSEPVARRLEAVRARTLDLVMALDWETLERQVLPILSPMIWDLGHIANFEELWIGRELGGGSAADPELDRMFDAARTPRSTRASLPLPTRSRLLAYLDAVRETTLEVLGSAAAGEDPLTAGYFVYEMVAEHEEQHQETLLQAMQILDAPGYPAPSRRGLPPPSTAAERGMIEIPAGPFRMGWAGESFAYDNERGAHTVDTERFRIARFPVTMGEYRSFVEDEGYARREWWSAEGRDWLARAEVTAPGNWIRRDGEWWVRFMDSEIPLPEERPVVHVCYHEAEAYARSVDRRLPTEQEWEKAALWDPADERSRPYPWGWSLPDPQRANLDQLGFQPAAIGSYPTGASASGVEQMIGDVWEWTASDFRPYPGFVAFPYREYSEIFFGTDYKVLRGGSWATRPAVARGTFRTWDYPIRRQIFAGFRCADDE